MTTKLNVTGLNCQNCVRHVREALERVRGVRNVQVDLDTGRAEVTHDGAEPADLIAAVEGEGYRASVAA